MMRFKVRLVIGPFLGLALAGASGCSATRASSDSSVDDQQGRPERSLDVRSGPPDGPDDAWLVRDGRADLPPAGDGSADQSGPHYTPFPPRLFLTRIGGSPLGTAPDDTHATWAKFDVVLANQGQHGNGATWAAVHALNKATRIFAYQAGCATSDTQKCSSPPKNNTIARWSGGPCGHSMGDIRNDNFSSCPSSPGMLLCDGAGILDYNPGLPALDYGLANTQRYWIEAVRTDWVGGAWEPDGVFTDLTFWSREAGILKSAKYSSDALWTAATLSFVDTVNSSTTGIGLLHAPNFGDCATTEGSAAWASLDALPHPPYAAMNEDAFVHGSTPGVAYVEWGAGWKRILDTMASMKKVRMLSQSRVGFDEGQSGKTTSVFAGCSGAFTIEWWQMLYYALASYFLGRNELTHFYFVHSPGGYSDPYWYSDYARLDLGLPLGPYQAVTHQASNGCTGKTEAGWKYFWREYERGYVFVNPYYGDMKGIAIPAPCKRIDHGQVDSDWSGLPTIQSLDLGKFTGAFLVKASLAR